VDQARGIAAKYGVLSVPTLLLFKGGAVKEQVVGLVAKRAITDRLDKVL
jgi:thioredoxin 1